VALWTRIEGMQALVETLEETLTGLLEYYGCEPTLLDVSGPGEVGAGPRARPENARPDGGRPPGAAPTFEAILESKKHSSADLPFKVRGTSPATYREAADLGKQVCATSTTSTSAAAGLRLDDLWIHTDPSPAGGPLGYFRQWFEAADGVLDAGSRLAQPVDVALYEFAVRRFGVRRDFVGWRPELSLNQRREREGCPEWAPQVETVDGGTVVKIRDEEAISM